MAMRTAVTMGRVPQYLILCVPQAFTTHPPEQVRVLAEACVEELLQRLLLAD
jgi:hypothetical protein